LATKSNSQLSKLSRYLPAVVMMFLIFIFSATPGSDLPNAGIFDYFFKKGGHMLGYALLAGSYWRAVQRYDWRGMKLSIGLTFLYAVSDEFHQLFTPGRHSSPLDVAIDLLGASLGLLVASVIIQKSHPINSEE
jgi:VanZ family protein